MRPVRGRSKEPAPLRVKEVRLQERRYAVCLNQEERIRDAAARQAFVQTLRRKLKGSDKALAEARFDGKWVLRTNVEFSTPKVPLKYKLMRIVEDSIRSIKSVLHTLPIHHKAGSARATFSALFWGCCCARSLRLIFDSGIIEVPC